MLSVWQNAFAKPGFSIRRREQNYLSDGRHTVVAGGKCSTVVSIEWSFHVDHLARRLDFSKRAYNFANAH